MSLVITLHVSEGIVMASDSRLTLDSKQPTDQDHLVPIVVPQSDSSYKTFLTPTRIGISTFGPANVGNVPIAGYIESFINEIAPPKELTVDKLATELLAYFRTFQPCLGAQFYIAGYLSTDSKPEQQVWSVDVPRNTCSRVNEGRISGLCWGGEADVMTRILKPMAQVVAEGQTAPKLPHYVIPWEYFTLQDAIDFAVFAIRSTIDVIRFQPRPKTVGGPIDVLVIKPTEAFWVQRKELHVA